MERVCAFDFDGTLTRHDTFGTFGRHAVGGKAYRRAILRSLPHIIAWKLGLLSGSAAKENLFGHLYRGMPHTQFAALGESFADTLDRDLHSDTMEILDLAHADGAITVIVSASLGDWIRPWASRHGFDRVLATEAEVDADGRLTGRFATANCHGDEKVARLRQAYPDRKSYRLSAYGDSSGDDALLAYADDPHRLHRRRPGKDILVFFSFLMVCALLVLALLFAWNRYITTPPYIDSSRYPIAGVDVSSHNGMINMDALARSGISFIFMKASEGSEFRDPNFALNYMKAEHAGLKRGAYHYFRFDRDGVEQALNVLGAMAGRPLELGIAIDVEEHGNATGVPTDSIRQRLQDMTDFLILKGHRVMFYSNRRDYERYLSDDFRGFPLWICSFEEKNASAGDWTFWQYDHRGSLPGVRGDIDLNVFSGDAKAWEGHLEEYQPR